MTVGRIISGAIEVYIVMIIIWVISSWFPNSQENKFMKLLGSLVEPYLRMFRFIPTFGGLDFTPILAVALLQALAGWIFRMGF